MTPLLLLLLAGCAIATPVERIIGGHDVTIEEYPWQAVLFYGDRGVFFCGASLIDPMWVLTAGHCMENSDPGDPAQLYIHLGQDDLIAPEVIPQVIHANEIFVHPGFLNEYDVDGVSLPNDLALIKLDTPAQLSARVQVIPMATDISQPAPYPASECDISGFGKTIEGTEEIEFPPPLLQAADTHVITNAECEAEMSYDPPRVLGIGQVCIIDPMAYSGPCSGDSGGPLTCYGGAGDTLPFLGGVTSYGTPPYCNVTEPSVYTRVASYHDWITTTILDNTGS